MKIIKRTVTESYRDKSSKFIGHLFHARDRETFDDQLQDLKSEYHDASHHCYAWRFNPAESEEFAQDDGEPGGTAGLPILNQLRSFEVVNAGLVVVRYFGGTKLGKPGLADAYGNTAAACLTKAKLYPVKLIWKVEVNYPYSEQNTVEKLIHSFDLIEINSSYMEEVNLTLACPLQHAEALKHNLQHLSHLDIKAKFHEKSFI